MSAASIYSGGADTVSSLDAVISRSTSNLRFADGVSGADFPPRHGLVAFGAKKGSGRIGCYRRA